VKGIISFNEHQKRRSRRWRSLPISCNDFQTLVKDNAQWRTLVAHDLVWELPYAPPIGHPARLSGRAGGSAASRNMVPGGGREFPLLRPQGVCLQRSGSDSRRSQGRGAYQTYGRIYLQDYVLFLHAAGDKIAFLREYFDPVRAAKALNTPILGLES
jgi:ketosteroid isomerase-like protein